MITIVIISKDNIEFLNNIINTFIDIEEISEILIIDSSKIDISSKIIFNNKKIKIIRLPPLGIVEFYEILAFIVATNNLLFFIEDDEFIDREEMLKLISILKKYYPKYKVFLIERENEGLFCGVNVLLRVFDKRFVKPIGIIHWHFITNKKPLKVPIKIRHCYNISFKQRLTKIKKFAFFDAISLGYKIYLILLANLKNINLYKIDGKNLNILRYKRLLNILYYIFKYNIFICSIMYIFISFLKAFFIFIDKNKKTKFKIFMDEIIYQIFVFYYLIRYHFIIYDIWIKLIKYDGFGNIFINSLEYINTLDYRNSYLFNFRKWIEWVVKKL